MFSELFVRDWNISEPWRKPRRTIGSLRNHDNNGNKNVKNLHIWQWKTIDLHALHVHFSFLDTLWTFSSFLWREMALFCSCEDDVSIRWQILSSSEALVPFNSWIVRTHFGTVMTSNDSERIAETRSYVFRRHSRCRRRRVCVNSLIILNRRQQIDWHLRKGKKCLSNVLSLIPYMTRKISAILRVFNTYISLITAKK